MGETGCGKTRLVKFMCQLQCPMEDNKTNLIIMKVHFTLVSKQWKEENDSNNHIEDIKHDRNKTA